MEVLGPIAEKENSMLLKLERQGRILRGRFTPGTSELEWCDRRLLARIHRYTLNRLRSEIEPVAAADFMRFLLHWQHVAAGEQLKGAEGLAAIVEQLEGFELATAAWEHDVLPARVRSEEHTSELQSLAYLVCRLLLEKKKKQKKTYVVCFTRSVKGQA